MKVKIQELLAGNSVWGELLEDKINGAVAFKVMEILRESEYKLKTFNESREKLIKDNGGVVDEKAEDENKRIKFPTKKDEEKVEQEFKELLESEVELHCRSLSIDDLDKLSIKPFKLGMIMWAVEK